MAEMPTFHAMLKELADQMPGKKPAPDSGRSAGGGAEIFPVDQRITEALLRFVPEQTPGVIEGGETADTISRRGHVAGLALAEEICSKGGNSQDFYKVCTGVKAYFTAGLCRIDGKSAQLRQHLVELDLFFGGLAAGFSQGRLRTVKAQFRRRLQEVKLHVLREKKRYATVFYQMNEPAFVVDHKLRLIDLNPACEKFFGLNKVELTGATCCQIIGQDYCKSCQLEEIIQTGGSFSNVEILVSLPVSEDTDVGDERTILMAATALGDINGGNRGGIVIFQDITEKKKAEDELDEYRNWLEDLVDERTEGLLRANDRLQREITERFQIEKELIQVTASLKQSNAELEQFAYVASHDLKEPLMLVASFAEKLMTRYSSSLDKRGQDYLTRIMNGTNKLQNLVEALLQLSKVSTRTAEFEPLDMNELVRGVVEDLGEIIGRSGARVEIDMLHDLNGDAVQIRQLFQNLISNALKYRREDEAPAVLITSRVLDGVCEITVEDNGIGLRDGDVDQIFEPFVRLHGRDKYEGTGMGLTTCRKIVARHGGEILARGKSGYGAVFMVRLPLFQPNSDEKI